MTKDEVSKLLGRPLTTQENANYDLYLEIAKVTLEEMLCIELEKQASNPTASARTFEVREGYSTVFTGIFTSLTEVKVDGVATTDYSTRYWDKRSNPYYNSIVLDKCNGKEVEVTGLWGFASIPNDLQMLWAQMFALVSQKRAVNKVKSKKVEDFAVTYSDETAMESFGHDNEVIINKYSLCNVGYVKHGDVC